MSCSVYHIFPYFSPERDALKERLAAEGIQTLCHYPVAIHRQPCFDGLFGDLDFPEAERIAREELSLPLSPAMTEEDILTVCRHIKGEATDQTPVPYLDLKAVNARYANELSAAAKCVVESGWYVNGSECKAFEEEFAGYCADKSGLMALHCVGCANGLDALTLILLALKQRHGWKADCEVIVPAMTFVATAQAVIRAGLTLRLADVTPNGLLDPMSAAMAITDKTVALLPVHLYGQRADMEALADLAQIHGLILIQDAAQAHGQPLDAAHADIYAAFSFYPGKNLGALGDGGAVVTDDEALARDVRRLANYGCSEKYRHEVPEAFNSRLDELQAALLRVKLRHLDEDNARRAALAKIYEETL